MESKARPQEHPNSRDVLRIATQESVKKTSANDQVVSSRALRSGCLSDSKK